MFFSNCFHQQQQRQHHCCNHSSNINNNNKSRLHGCNNSHAYPPAKRNKTRKVEPKNRPNAALSISDHGASCCHNNITMRDESPRYNSSIAICSQDKSHQEAHLDLMHHIRRVLRTRKKSSFNNSTKSFHRFRNRCHLLKEQLLNSLSMKQFVDPILFEENFTGEECYLMSKLCEYSDASNKGENQNPCKNNLHLYYLDLGAEAPRLHPDCLYEKALHILSTHSDNRKSRQEAKRLLTLAADAHNHESSHLELGNLLADEGAYSDAHHHLLQAAKLGSAEAYNNLGDLYLNGFGVEIDFSVAEQLFSAAVKRGYHFGLVNLGFLCEQLHRTEEALHYYLLAGKRGLSAGYFNLGVLFTKGDGSNLDVDHRKARQFFQLAYDLDSTDEIARQVLEDFELALRNETCLGAL